MLLENKVAIVTGGAGTIGLGFATARLMAAHGARVVIVDLERAEPAAAAARIGSQHLGIVADVAGACLYLASDLSAYCTGITLDVNGGMLIH